MTTAVAMVVALSATVASESKDAPLEALDALVEVFNCLEACASRGGVPALVAECQQSECGDLPADADKNADGRYDMRDRLLAALEYLDDEGDLICRETAGDDSGPMVIKPRLLCDELDCEDIDPDLDTDGDGLTDCVEAAVNAAESAGGEASVPLLDATVFDASCGTEGDCGFDQSCYAYAQSLADGRCADRECALAGCPAFELETVEADSDQLLVRVHFLHSPRPATVLDLRLWFPPQDLAVLDTRPLPALTEGDKTLYTTFSDRLDGSARVMRLVVLGRGQDPIANGPLVEILFRRLTTNAASLRFSTVNAEQIASMAPEQGAHYYQLADDARWGDPVTVSAALPGQGKRLLNWFDFSLLDQPRVVPTNLASDLQASAWCPKDAEEICKEPNGWASRLRLALRGSLQGGQPLAGPSGNAVFLNGFQDVLELPYFVSTPISEHVKQAHQAFSAGLWFFIDAADAGSQVLWAHADGRSADGPRMKWALVLEQADGDDSWRLEGSVGPLGSDTSPRTPLVSGLATNQWHHLGFAIDPNVALDVDGNPLDPEASEDAVDAWGRLRLVLNSTPVPTQLALRQPTASDVVTCPGMLPAGYRFPRRGESPNAPPAQTVFISLQNNGLSQVHRLDPSGFRRRVVLEAGRHGFGKAASFRDPDYNRDANKILFSSDEGGGWEIWIANPDGSDARAATTGFSDPSRGTYARRPRWAPDGSGFVFESNAFGAATGTTSPPVHNGAGAVHLYYLPFDGDSGEVAAKIGAQTVSKVAYAQVALSRNDFDLNASAGQPDNSWSKAAWLRGKHTNHSGESVLGVVAFDVTGDASGVTAMRLAEVFGDTKVTGTAARVVPLGGLLQAEQGDRTQSVRLLAARLQGQSGETQQWMVARQAKRDDNIWASQLALLEVTVQAGGEPTVAVRQRYELGDFGLDRVSSASWAPGVASSLVLAGYRQGRPVLVRAGLDADAGYAAASTERIVADAKAVDSVRWVTQPAYMACNWIGGFPDAATGRLEYLLRGGLDEVRVYSYLRSAEAFRSDYERMLERLPPAQSPDTQHCLSSVECADFHICREGTCLALSCDPADPEVSSACDGGACVLRPSTVQLSAQAEDPSSPYVCSHDCSVNAECFQQECLNGPCRYCADDVAACVECVSEPGANPEQPLVLGCPDANAFACFAGSCVSDCYRFEDGESEFLCDFMTQSCRQAACESEPWHWQQLSPATFSGLGRTRIAGVRYNKAIPEVFPISVTAFGVGDSGHVPVIAVEASTKPSPQEDDWFQVGQIAVHHHSMAQAASAPYVLQTLEYIEWVRLRLVEPEPLNVRLRSCLAGGEGYNECRRRNPAPIATAGVPITVSHVQRVGCSLNNDAPCAAVNQDWRPHFRRGQSGVVVTELRVNGTTATGSMINVVCDLKLHPELSAVVDYTSLVRQGTDEEPPPFPVLNCSAPGAGMTVDVVPPVQPTVHGAITETDNLCIVELIGRGGSVRHEVCFEYLNDPSLDPLSAVSQPTGDYELSNFTSFAIPTASSLGP